MNTTVVHSFPVWLPQTQTWMYNQIRYLPHGVDAHVCCERTQNLDQFSLPNIHCFQDVRRGSQILDAALRRFRFRPYLRYLCRVAVASHADVLHSHFGPVAWSDLVVARRIGMRHVVTFYGQDVNYLPQHRPAWRRRYVELFNSVDAVLCEGRHMAACIRALGCPERKIRVHRLGISLDDIPYKPLEWTQGEPLKVLIAASFREKKGIPCALEALGRLRHGTQIEVTVIGDAGDDPRSAAEKKRILAMRDHLGLGGEIRWLGFQSHRRLLDEAYRHHVFLSPSITATDGDTEGGAPVTLIEMSAAGLIVVSTRHCDIPSVVIDRETGLLAEERDIDGLVENLSWLLQHPDRWGRMRRAARAHIENGYDARRQSACLAGIYKELTEQS